MFSRDMGSNILLKSKHIVSVVFPSPTNCVTRPKFNQIYLAKASVLNLLLPISHDLLTLEMSNDVPPPPAPSSPPKLFPYCILDRSWTYGMRESHSLMASLHYTGLLVLWRRGTTGKGVLVDVLPDETLPCQITSDWECFHTVSSPVYVPKGTSKRVGINS